MDELVVGFRGGDIFTLDRLFGKAGTEAVLALPEGDRDDVLHHLERMLDRIAVDTHSDAADVARLDATVAKVRRAAAEVQAKRAKQALVAAVTTMGMHKPSATREAHPATEKRQAAPPEDTAASPRTGRRQTAIQGAKEKQPKVLSNEVVSKPGTERHSDAAPHFSALWPAFLAEKKQSHDGHKGYSETTMGQSEKTSALFLELVGDKPLDRYTGTDAQLFRDLLLRLPQSHGKAKAATGGRRFSAREEIQRADASQAALKARNAALPNGEEKKPDVPRLKLKTVKRHFSTLRQFFDFLSPLGHVQRNVFAGFKYPGTRSGKKKRDEWSVDALNVLLGSDWFSPTDGREDFMWMTAIGMFSGMRAEEIARLRCIDVKVAGDTAFFDIVEQPDGWTPKTEAGVRVVPIHPFLLENGFLDYVQLRRADGSIRLFPALRGQGPDGKLSGSFSRSFSRMKIRLGIGPKIVFHSFRHSVRTILTNKPPALVRDAWIDAVMGHSAEDGDRRGGGGPSTGETVYTKQIQISNLLVAISAIEYPAEVELAKLREGLNKTLPG